MRALNTSPRIIGALAALVLLASCSSGRNTDAADATPTFRQVRDDVLRYEEPISQVADLLPPTAEGQPWRIFGGVLDPENGRTQAAVWSTTTPAGWEKTDIAPAEAGVSEMMSAATPYNDSLMAVGKVGEGSRGDAAVWRSDGDSWSRSTPAEMGGKHEQWAFDVTAGQGGILVAGGESTWGEIRPRLWHSTDGSTWTSVDGGPGGPLDATGEESVQAIHAFAGGFVAVGMRDIDGNQDGMVWFSPDGTTWENVDVPSMGGPGRQNALALAVLNGVIVAGGYQVDGEGHGQPVVWSSLDGRTWGNASVPLPLHPGRSAVSDLAVRSLAVDGQRLIAAGGNDWQPHIWVSDDIGGSWATLDDPVSGAELFKDGVDLVDVGSAFGAFLALGDEPTVMELRRGRWSDATGTNFPTGGNRPQATSVLLDEGKLMTAGFNFTSAHGDQRKRYTGRIWRKEGSGFDVIEPSEDKPALEEGQINDIARIKNGYVAVGFEDFSYANQRKVADGQPDGLLWTSEDGATWNRQAAEIQQVDANPLTVLGQDPNAVAASAMEIVATQPMISLAPVGGQGTRSLEAVAPLGDGYIAVGSAYADGDGDPNTPGFDTNPVVVVSPDGLGIIGEDPQLAGPGTQRLMDVCVAEDGTAVAVGSSGSDRNFDVAVRRRDAAGVWTGSTSPDNSFIGDGSQEALACAAGPDGFVMVGTDDSRGNVDARIWTSPDGFEWQELPSGALGGTGNQTATAVAAVPDGGWLVGGTDTMSGDSDLALWRVRDDKVTRRDRGETSLAGPGDQLLESLVVTGNRAVIVGQDQTGVGIWETGRLDR